MQCCRGRVAYRESKQARSAGYLQVIGYDSIEYASLTDVGIRRSHNQDAHATLLAGDADQWAQRGHIFMVADGMGGHAVGEMASKLAVDIIPHTYHKHAANEGVPALRKAFVEANASIHARGQQNPEFGGMGTTTTALLLRPDGAWIGHVGDSRAYRIRDGQIEQLSFDHSLVWEMARRQGVDPDGLHDVNQHVIIRSLGPEPLVQVDVEGPHRILPGDIFLLCSDGLSGPVSDPEIGAIASTLPPAEACRFLVDLANLRGGPDNITVLIVKVKDVAGRKPETRPGHTPWYRHLRWWVWSLALGVVLACYAIVLKFYGHGEAGIAVFGLAVVAIVAGLIGLSAFLQKEKKRLAAELDLPTPQIYRSSRCQIERALVEKLSKAVAALKQQLDEKQWGVEREAYEKHLEQAEHLAKQGQMVDSFREYCRAMRCLAEAVRRQRPKGEAFNPVWDRPAMRS